MVRKDKACPETDCYLRPGVGMKNDNGKPLAALYDAAAKHRT